jgi:hypothetical protein
VDEARRREIIRFVQPPLRQMSPRHNRQPADTQQLGAFESAPAPGTVADGEIDVIAIKIGVSRRRLDAHIVVRPPCRELREIRNQYGLAEQNRRADPDLPSPCTAAHDGRAAVERQEALPHIGSEASAGLAQDHVAALPTEQG